MQNSPCSQPLYIDIGFAGGDTGRFLAETEAWIRAHGVGNKTLGAEMWDALSAEAKSKHPRVLARHAMLKMCFVEKDQMNLSVNDVKRMLNTPAVQEALSRAEEYMTSMRKVREKSTRTPEEIAGHIGFADIKLMEVLLDRKRRECETMDEVYLDFLTKIDLAHLHRGPAKNLGSWCAHGASKCERFLHDIPVNIDNICVNTDTHLYQQNDRMLRGTAVWFQDL